MHLHITLLFLFSLFSTTWLKSAPEKKTINGVTYHILEAKPSDVRIVWKDQDGERLFTFAAAKRYLERDGATVSTVMNGGIFEPGFTPSGLLIQNKNRLHPVNRKTGRGNFFLKPNGIFLTSSKGAAVIGTEEYPPKGNTIHYAVQSGPLLLQNGKIHPRFNAASTSRLHRNGVGISKSGKVIFAITDFHSQKFPNLHEFAELFRSLGCQNALFLDGDLSQMKSGNDMAKPSNNFASIIAVVSTQKTQPAPAKP